MEFNPPGTAAMAIPAMSNTVSTISKIASNRRVRPREPPTPPPPPPGPPGLLPPGGGPLPPLAAVRLAIAAPAPPAAIFPESPCRPGGAASDPLDCITDRPAMVATGGDSDGDTRNLLVCLLRGAAGGKLIIPGPALLCSPAGLAGLGCSPACTAVEDSFSTSCDPVTDGECAYESAPLFSSVDPALC